MNEAIPFPTALLKQRTIKRMDGQIQQYLVKWSDIEKKDSMWDAISLQKMLPSLKIQDKLSFKEGSDERYIYP